MPPPSRQGQKNTASQDQAGKSRTGDGAGDYCSNIDGRVHLLPSCRRIEHKFGSQRVGTRTSIKSGKAFTGEVACGCSEEIERWSTWNSIG